MKTVKHCHCSFCY